MQYDLARKSRGYSVAIKGNFHKWLPSSMLIVHLVRTVIAPANFDQKNLISPTTAVLAGTFKGPTTGALLHTGSRQTTPSDLLVRFFFSSDYENAVGTPGVTRVFDLGGSVLVQASNLCVASAFVTGITDLSYLVACVNSGIDVYKIDALNGVNVVNTALSLSSAHNLALSKIFLSIGNSNMIVSGSSGAKLQSALYIIDSSNLNIQTFQPLIPAYSNTQRISAYIGSMILAVGNYTNIIIWDISSFSNTRLVSSTKVSDTILFNAENGGVFTIVPNGVNTDIKRVNISGSSVLDLAVTAISSALSSLIPFKGYPYLMSSEPNGNCVRVYSDNLLVQIYTSCSMPKLNYNNFIGAVEVADSFFYFGFGRSLAPFNFIPSTMHLGYCSKVTENAAANCLKCVRGYYLNPTNLCTSIPRGYGIDPATSSIRPCPQGCEECYDNFVVCQKCRNFEGYFQDPVSLSCIFRTKINDFYGGNLVTGFIAPCLIGSCLDCKKDHSQCQICRTDYFLVLQNGTCSRNTLEGFGLQTLSVNSTVLVRCLNSNCGECSASYSICRKCKSGYYFLANDSSNCNKNTLQGYGVASELAIDVCQDANCESCFDDFKNCSFCRPNYFLLQQPDSSWGCKPKSRVELESAYFDNKKDQVVMTFKETLKPLDYRQLLLFMLVDKFGSPVAEYKLRSVVLDSVLRKTLTVNINFKQNCIECSFSVLPGTGFISGESGNFYLDAIAVGPITTSVLPIDNFFDLNQMQSAGKIMSSTLQAAAQIMIIFGSSQVQLAKVMDEFELFLFLNGKRNSLIDSFVTLFSFEVWNILPNLLKIEESQIRCIPDLNFSRQGRSCNLLNNHGSKILGLTAVFFLVVIREGALALIKICLRSKSPSPLPAADFPKTRDTGRSAELLAKEVNPGSRSSIYYGATVIPVRRRIIFNNPGTSELDVQPMQPALIRDSNPGFEHLPELGKNRAKVNSATRNSFSKDTQIIKNTQVVIMNSDNERFDQAEFEASLVARNKPWLAQLLGWPTVVRAFDAAQIDLLLFSMVNVGSINQQPLHLVGAVVSTLIILGYSVLLTKVTQTTLRLYLLEEELGRRENVGTLEVFLAKQTGPLQYLYDGYRFDSRGPKMLLVLAIPVLNMLRSGIELFFIAFLSGKGNLQLFILIMLDTCFLAVLAKCRPYRVQARNVEDLIIRATLIVVHIVYLIYQYVSVESIMKDRIFGWTLVSLLVVIILANYGPSTIGALTVLCRKNPRKTTTNENPKLVESVPEGHKNPSPKQIAVRRLTLSKKPQSSNILPSNHEPSSAGKFVPDRSSTVQLLLKNLKNIEKDDQKQDSESPPQQSVIEPGGPSTYRSNAHLGEPSILMVNESPKKPHKGSISSPQRISGKSGALRVSLGGTLKASNYINNIVIHQANNFMQPPKPKHRKMSNSQRSIRDMTRNDPRHNQSLLTSGHLSDESRLAKPRIESSNQL